MGCPWCVWVVLYVCVGVCVHKGSGPIRAWVSVSECEWVLSLWNLVGQQKADNMGYLCTQDVHEQSCAESTTQEQRERKKGRKEEKNRRERRENRRQRNTNPQHIIIHNTTFNNNNNHLQNPPPKRNRQMYMYLYNYRVELTGVSKFQCEG